MAAWKVYLWCGLAGALAGCSGTLVRVSQDVSIDSPWNDYELVVIRTVNGAVELTTAADVQGVRVRGQKSAGGLTAEEARRNLEQVEVAVGPDESNPKSLLVELRFPEELRTKNVAAGLHVTVPEAVAADVTTGNGSILVRGMRDMVVLRTSNGRITVDSVDGTVDAHTSNGRIEASAIAGEFRARTSNGAIVARQIGGDCRAETSNGPVEALGVAGNVAATTSNGRVVVDATPAEQGTVEVKASNGSIELTLPRMLKGRLLLRTSNGSVRTSTADMSLSQPQSSRGHFEALMNGGGEGRVLASTSNGSITLNCR
jgi:DUF4097 and DUF4098 domain-containing protein YvlB